ncbi:MAG: glycosyltransferase [Bacteroidales bacterium]
MKRVIVILGMHRCGTSVAARAIETLGASLGENLMDADEFNPRGYFEDKNIFRLNEEIMTSFGIEWDSLRLPDRKSIIELCSTPFFEKGVEIFREKVKDTNPTGIKDPRFSILLPFWEKVFEKSEVTPTYVIVVRNPLSVANSLFNRNQTPAIKSYWLWVIHFVHCLVNTSEANRMVTDFDELMENPDIQFERLAAELKLQVNPERKREFLTQFLYSRSDHSGIKNEMFESTDGFPRIASEIYHSLKAMALGKISKEEIRELQFRWERELESLQSLLTLNQESEHRFWKMVRIANERMDIIKEFLTRDEEKSQHILQFPGEPVINNDGLRLTDKITRIPSFLSRFVIAARIIWLHRNSIYFNPEWYLTKYPDVKDARKNALIHFAWFGIMEERSPNQEFECADYLILNPDVAHFGMSPVIHFMLKGFREERNWKREHRIALAGKTAIPTEYGDWITANEKPQITDSFLREHGPLISILLPVFTVKKEFLEKALISVTLQHYQNWELCIIYTDLSNSENLALIEEFAGRDHRVKFKKQLNEGISGNSNAALDLARGEFIALLDHDDELSSSALQEIAKVICSIPEVDFLYTDKDSISEDSSIRQNPLFKPDWSPEMMYSVNYVTHLNIIRKNLAIEVGGFRSCTDGAQDWDFFLRVSEKARKIVHVPGVHYHWRIHEGSVSTGLSSKPYAPAAQLLALRDSFARRGIPALIEPDNETGFSIHWNLEEISEVLLLIDGTGIKKEVLYDRITGVLKTTSQLPPNFCRVILLADSYSCHWLQERFENYIGVEIVGAYRNENAGIINDILYFQHTSYRAIVFLSARINILSANWLTELVGWVIKHPEIGFATGIILDENDRFVESGLVSDEQSNWTPIFRGSPLNGWGWSGGPLWYRNISACNPWIVALNAEACNSTGKFDEQTEWPQAFIQKCVNIGKTGMRGLTNPHVKGILAEKDSNPSHLPLTSFAIESLVHAKSFKCSSSELAEQQQHPERIGKGDGSGWCNWFIPSFDHPYGGIMTILRFAAFMRRLLGIRQRFIGMFSTDLDSLKKSVTTLFPLLSDSIFMKLPADDELDTIPSSDYSFATLWTTAYTLLKVRNTGVKFYFIQDFEPIFYPAGSAHALAELTYRFGFIGVTNTLPIRHKYEKEYHGTAIHFVPQADVEVFYGNPLRAGNKQKRIFFYARPGTPRNGFEIGSEALRILKRRLGQRVSILCAGEHFDERRYGLVDVVQNLGVLNYTETADLYRTCDIGLVIMMTQHPSYLPFELMACGALLVSNHHPVNNWLLKGDENCLLALPNPVTLAEKLEQAVIHFDQYTKIRKNGHDLIHTSYNNWDDSFTPVMHFIDGMRF